MQDFQDTAERRTTTDAVFERLLEEIVSLKLLPGEKLSEAEVARRFGVSRQPVRDAFNRLENLDLLKIRPQRATKVRGFSMSRIANARLIRLAVELEVIRRACSLWDEARAEALERNLSEQQRAVDTGDLKGFHALDYQFHKSICQLAGCSLAFETIEACKQKVDRLCVLSLSKANESAILLEDHRALARALSDRSAEEATAIARRHLTRLDDTISEIHRVHSEYFE